MGKWKDEEIIEHIQSGDWNSSLRYIFFESGWRESVLKFITDNNGSQEDAEDVFQETLIDFAFQVKRHDFNRGSKLFTYFFKIGKNKWLKELEKRKRRQGLLIKKPLPQPDFLEKATDFEVLLMEKTDLLLSVLQKLGEGCKKTLLLYGEGYKFKEIAEKLGLKNADGAKNKKSRCSRRFFDFLEDNPETYKLLRE